MEKLDTRLKNFFYIPFATVGSKNRLPAPQGRGASPKHLFFGEVEGRGTLAQRGKANGNLFTAAYMAHPLPPDKSGGSPSH